MTECTCGGKEDGWHGKTCALRQSMPNLNDPQHRERVIEQELRKLEALVAALEAKLRERDQMILSLQRNLTELLAQREALKARLPRE